MQAVCCSRLLWYREEQLFFDNELWGFVLHPGPLVEEQMLYLEAGKLGWSSWGSWLQSEQGNCQSERQPSYFELERRSRVFLPTLQIKLLWSYFFSGLCIDRKVALQFKSMVGFWTCYSQKFPTFLQLH